MKKQKEIITFCKSEDYRKDKSIVKKEIEFKARTIESNEWVFGYYVIINGISKIIDKAGDSHCVNPDTLCQYLGALDKKGNKIYEYDYTYYCDCHEWTDEQDWTWCEHYYYRNIFIINIYDGKYLDITSFGMVDEEDYNEQCNYPVDIIIQGNLYDDKIKQVEFPITKCKMSEEQIEREKEFFEGIKHNEE
jgi:hypothetical protein